MAPSKKKSTKKSAPAKKTPIKKTAPKKTKNAKPSRQTEKRMTAAETEAETASAAFKPIDDRVLIAVEEAAETTAGGIIIPGNVDSRPNRGLILAKGPGRKSKKGKIRPLDVNVGDRVLFPEFAGTKIEIGGEDFLILREEELLGIVT